MSKSASLFAALFLCLAGAPLARAESGIDAARQAFVAGDFAAAAAMAGTVKDADGYALTARAVLADALYRDHDRSTRLRLAKRGHQLAKQALAARPDHVEAHLQAAIGLGLLAKNAGTFEAMNENYAERIKRHLDAALAVDPDNPYALGFLALWHTTVVAKAGTTMARNLFGADLTLADPLFARLLADPSCPPIVVLELARGLAALDRPDDRVAADAALARLADRPARTEIDRLAIQLARSDLAARTQIAAATP